MTLLPRLPLSIRDSQSPIDKRREGEQFEMVGKVFYYFVPILAALGLVVGAVASQTYNTGADVFIKVPSVIATHSAQSIAALCLKSSAQQRLDPSAERNKRRQLCAADSSKGSAPMTSSITSTARHIQKRVWFYQRMAFAAFLATYRAATMPPDPKSPARACRTLERRTVLAMACLTHAWPELLRGTCGRGDVDSPPDSQHTHQP